MKVTFNPAARAELADAVTFYNEQATGLGDAFAAEVRQTVLRVLVHPDAGHSVRPRVRRRLVLRFPYSVLYSVGRADHHPLMTARLANIRWYVITSYYACGAFLPDHGS